MCPRRVASRCGAVTVPSRAPGRGTARRELVRASVREHTLHRPHGCGGNLLREGELQWAEDGAQKFWINQNQADGFDVSSVYV